MSNVQLIIFWTYIFPCLLTVILNSIFYWKVRFLSISFGFAFVPVLNIILILAGCLWILPRYLIYRERWKKILVTIDANLTYDDSLFQKIKELNHD